jgi:hypothetical protein
MGGLNNIQKVFIMLFVGSFVILYVSIEGSAYHGWRSFWDMFRLNASNKQNTIGLVALFNIVVSALGFFLFKGK